MLIIWCKNKYNNKGSTLFVLQLIMWLIHIIKKLAKLINKNMNKLYKKSLKKITKIYIKNHKTNLRHKSRIIRIIILYLLIKIKIINKTNKLIIKRIQIQV